MIPFADTSGVIVRHGSHGCHMWPTEYLEYYKRDIMCDPSLSDDQSDASVACDCDSQYNNWYCWTSCANYDGQISSSGEDWFCPECLCKC